MWLVATVLYKAGLGHILQLYFLSLNLSPCRIVFYQIVPFKLFFGGGRSSILSELSFTLTAIFPTIYFWKKM